MPTKVGNCKLCKDENVELKNSHIIPEFCYKRVYTKKHKLKGFSPINGNDLDMEQKGYREYLLCGSCEEKLSKWENSFSWLMEDIINNDTRKIQITNINKFDIVSGFDYESIKRAILSIIWRLSLSSLDVFKEYTLGPYEEKLRKKLYSNQYIDPKDYPIVISKGLLKGKFLTDILAHHGKSRHTNEFRMHTITITINGFIIDTLITENRKIPKAFHFFSMNNTPSVSGDIIISHRNLEDQEFKIEAYSERFRQSDVNDFYRKYD